MRSIRRQFGLSGPSRMLSNQHCFAERAGEEVRCPRHQTIERWVARQLGAVEHERRVTTIASSLFELTWPLHQLAEGQLEMLRLAAVVHDVGRSIHNKTHPVQGARMVLSESSLPLTMTERRALAYLTLYHKGPVPDAGRDAVLSRSDDADRLRQVLSLLRAADALDSRSLESPRLVFALVGRATRLPTLHVTCYLKTACAKTRRVYQRRKKFRLLEELLACQVEIEVAQAASLGMVA
jgi:exopolyphosphatase/pppGpp-phosphohydrolase